jgi:hypothetical protein
MRTNHAAFYVVDMTDDKLFIVDLELGKTITNDAEAVCRQCQKLAPGHRIIYRDTDRNWDELQHINGEFIGFAPYTEQPPALMDG